MLKSCLEEACCVGLALCDTIIFLLLYVDDIVLMVRSLCNVNKQLKILKICTCTTMITNNEKNER